jgi:hypothetical protein
VITDIVLTAEKSKNKPLDYENLNTDVIVHFDTGDRYIATFFSHKSLVDMLEMDKRSGDFYLDQYYKILDMVLIRDFNNGDLHAVIENMISEGDFQLVFKKI